MTIDKERVARLREMIRTGHLQVIGNPADVAVILNILDDYQETKAEAELELARPLLEAVNEARIYWDNRLTPISMSEVSQKAVIERAIEYAALAHSAADAAFAARDAKKGTLDKVEKWIIHRIKNLKEIS